MDFKTIKQIVDLMKRSDLTEFEIEEKDLKLRICRSKGEQTTVVTTGTATPFPATVVEQVAAAPPAPPPSAEEKQPEAEDTTIGYIKSPMVGTFYRAPSPESPPFVEEDAKVKEDTVVCIIEAMKVMNEIQAEISGTIIELLVEDGSSIEFGQPLFNVKKA